jgi:hypothetical protein
MIESSTIEALMMTLMITFGIILYSSTLSNNSFFVLAISKNLSTYGAKSTCNLILNQSQQV